MNGFGFGSFNPMGSFGSPSTGMGLPGPSPVTPVAPAVAPTPAASMPAVMASGSGAFPAGSFGVQMPQALSGMVQPAPMGGLGSGQNPSQGGFMGGLGQSLGGMFKNPDGSMNYQGIGVMAGGLQALGSFWNARQSMNLAREGLDMQRDAYRTNLENQTQTYNTTLEDRIRTRSVVEGKGSKYADDYLKKHRL